MMSLLREPLLHFLAIGAALFLYFHFSGGGGACPGSTRIQRPWTRIAVRVAGSWLAAVGLLMLGWGLRGVLA